MLKHRLDRMELLLRRREGAAAAKRAARPLRTPQDLLELLHEQVEALQAEPYAGAVEKARAVGYVAGLALRVIQVKDLAARIEMLELVLKQRKGDKA